MELFNCRLCNGSLKTVLDLGSLFISSFPPNNANFGEKEPLALAVCEQCGFAQLKHMVDPDKMYREYWYKSSLNASMLHDLKDIVDSALARWKDNDKCSPVALDIGCNDGSMLAMYPKRFKTVGFDPALNLRAEAEANCDYFINDYFTAEVFPLAFAGKADIVTAIAMFYDLNEPAGFLNDVHSIMSDDGIFVIQMTDAISMLKANAFDNICHEHAGYYTLEQFVRLLNKNGFIVFDVEYNEVNGGSVRAYATKNIMPREYKILPSVLNAIGAEAVYLRQYDDPFLAFSIRVMNAGLIISRFMLSCCTQGIPVYALGASTKGNTLLQYFGLDRFSICAIGEVNEDKIGRRTVGSGIRIVSEKEVLDKNPPYLMILPWHFRNFFIGMLWHKMERDGVTLIFPLPEPELVTVRNGELHVERITNKEMIVPWAR